MKIELQCFHDEPEFKGHVMIETDVLENNMITFKCPKCEKETLVFLRVEE